MENRIVVFLDILGFKELVKELKDDDRIQNKIFNILKFNKFEMDKLAWNKKRKELKDKFDFNISNIANVDYEITAFSDSIVLSSKPEEFKNLFIKVFEVIRELFLQGFLCRGGCSYGKVFHKDGIIFGDAYINSYKIENNLAKYPRVIVTGKVKEIIKEEWRKELIGIKNGSILEGVVKGLNKYSILTNICDDIDGLTFINPFPTKIYYFEKLRNDLKSEKYILESYKNILIKKITKLNEIKTIKDISILSKLFWMINKYNEIVVKKWNEVNLEKIENIKFE